MTPHEQMCRALAAVDGDPDELLPVRIPGGSKANVPRWTKYRGKADAALKLILSMPDVGPFNAIVAERKRQLEVLGYDAAEDDQYVLGELARAGAAYAYRAGQPDQVRDGIAGEVFPHFWPWDPKHWSPGERRRELIKAAALIIAELARLDRADARAEDPANDLSQPKEAE